MAVAARDVAARGKHPLRVGTWRAGVGHRRTECRTLRDVIAQRHCSKPGCSTAAVATLTYDYRDSTCARNTRRISPRRWAGRLSVWRPISNRLRPPEMTSPRSLTPCVASLRKRKPSRLPLPAPAGLKPVRLAPRAPWEAPTRRARSTPRARTRVGERSSRWLTALRRTPRTNPYRPKRGCVASWNRALPRARRSHSRSHSRSRRATRMAAITISGCSPGGRGV